MHLLIIGVLPAIVLMVVIYNCDKVEREPIGLVIGMMGFGMLTILPTLICEMIAQAGLQLVFDSEMLIYKFLEAFFGVALIEEFWKLFAVRLFRWNKKAKVKLYVCGI